MINAHDLAPNIGCDACHLNRICLPNGRPAAEISALSQLVRQNRRLLKGEVIYRAGQRFSGIYALKSGSAKLVHTDALGRESVIALQLPGELVGFDGLASGRHRCALIALESTGVCELPARELEALGQRWPTVQQFLLQRSCEQFDLSIERLAASHRPAEERLAGFLLDLAARYRRRGLAIERFQLSLTRQDIGHHLGLALETVSRTLGRFEDSGLLKVQGKEVRLLDVEALSRVAGEGRVH